MNTEPREGVDGPAAAVEEIKQRLRQSCEETEARVCEYLERLYGRRFSVCSMISDPGIGRVKLTVRAEDEPVVRFTVEMDGEESIHDTYVCTLCLNELTQSIERALPGTAANAALLQDHVKETDVSLSMAAYLRKYNVRRILTRLIVEEANALERTAVEEVFSNASRELDADIAVYVYTLGHEDFQNCCQMFRDQPSVSEAMVGHYSPIMTYSFLVGNGAAR